EVAGERPDDGARRAGPCEPGLEPSGERLAARGLDEDEPAGVRRMEGGGPGRRGGWSRGPRAGGRPGVRQGGTPDGPFTVSFACSVNFFIRPSFPGAILQPYTERCPSGEPARSAWRRRHRPLHPVRVAALHRQLDLEALAVVEEGRHGDDLLAFPVDD